MTTAKKDMENTKDANAVGIESTALFGIWQPIDTAPKNENVLVVWGGGGIAVASWNPCTERWYEGHEGIDKVTHWMPLPNLPNVRDHRPLPESAVTTTQKGNE